MNIPKLAVNPSHLFPEEYYQITNISDDKKYYDFMGFKRLSVENTWAANIIRERLDPNYYDNLDYELTSDDLDKQDISCIAEGIVELDQKLNEIPNDIIPTRPPLKGLDWEELEQLSKGEKDMTREEIDRYVMETYHLDFNSIQKDNEVVKRHEFIAEQLSNMNIEEEPLQEEKQENGLTQEDLEAIDEMVASKEEGEVQAEEQLKEYLKSKENESLHVIPNEDLLRGENLEEIKKEIIDMGGDASNDSSYASFSTFFKTLFGEEDFKANKESLKGYIGTISQQLGFKPKNKLVYKGVIKFVALELGRQQLINKPVFGDEIDKILNI